MSSRQPCGAGLHHRPGERAKPVTGHGQIPPLPAGEELGGREPCPAGRSLSVLPPASCCGRGASAWEEGLGESGLQASELLGCLCKTSLHPKGPGGEGTPRPGGYTAALREQDKGPTAGEEEEEEPPPFASCRRRRVTGQEERQGSWAVCFPLPPLHNRDCSLSAAAES